jgi:hypothetical protein
LLIAAVLGLAAVGITRLNSVHIPFVTDTCRVFAGEHVVRVEPEQLTHAATIAAVGVRRQLPERAVTIALATAWQESKLRNLPSGDRDSIGLFQQRPSQGWGTPEQLNNPRYAAGEFYTHLLKIRGWEGMRLTDAAQAVQRSGHPEAYQKWEVDAKALAVAFLGTETGAVTCQLRQRTERTGEAAMKEIVTEIAQDLGKLSVSSNEAGAEPLITVAVGGGGDSTLGWRTAHWFVAKSHHYGVERVAYAGKVWTADSGKWQDDAKASKSQVAVRIAPNS